MRKSLTKKQVLDALTQEKIEEYIFDGCDMSDVGNAIGILLGHLVTDPKDDDECSEFDLVGGLAHGISTIHGTH